MRPLLAWLVWAVVRMAPQKDPGDAADLEAVRRMAEGDGQGLATLYDRHARVTYSLALRILGEPLEAEEVVQDVFSQAWKQAARYDRSRGAVVAWLLMMTRSRSIDRVRARRAMPQSSAAYMSRSLTVPVSGSTKTTARCMACGSLVSGGS